MKPFPRLLHPVAPAGARSAVADIPVAGDELVAAVASEHAERVAGGVLAVVAEKGHSPVTDAGKVLKCYHNSKRKAPFRRRGAGTRKTDYKCSMRKQRVNAWMRLAAVVRAGGVGPPILRTGK